MKKILICLLILAMLFSLAACGKDDDTTSDGDNTVASQEDGAQNDDVDIEDETFEYADNYIDNHLKGDYSITYKMVSNSTDSEETSYDITMIRTSEGYYTKISDESEMLFIKNGEKYDMYVGDEENGFQTFEGMTYTEDEVKSYSQAFLGYMSQYEQEFDSLKRSGNTSVAGRDCEKYTYKDSAIVGNVKVEYCIDKETGVCMKYYVEGKTLGQEASYQFECTEFITSGVSLPAYN